MAGKCVGAGQKFLPFEQALVYARSLKLKAKAEWVVWSKSGGREATMPSRPDQIYKHDGWQGYGHWLGTGNVCGGNGRQFLTFDKALVYARTLKLKNAKEWEDWARTGVRPANMPSHPDVTYKHDGWQGYGHWLGTGNLVGGKLAFLPFKKALLYARTLKMKSVNEWKDWAKTGVRPANIPSTPHKIYKLDGWHGYGHWLGTGAVALQDKQFLPFKKALLYARSLKLKGKKEWEAWRKSNVRPDNVPSNPNTTYKHDGWQGYGHWLGTGNVCGGNGRQFLAFDKALVYARSLNLKRFKEWRDWCKSGVRPANVPANPETTYKRDGWQGYVHWLGTANKEALLHVRSLKLKNVNEWKPGQDCCAACQHAFPPRYDLQARRMARLWALAWHRHRCPQRKAAPSV